MKNRVDELEEEIQNLRLKIKDLNQEILAEKLGARVGDVFCCDDAAWCVSREFKVTEINGYEIFGIETIFNSKLDLANPLQHWVKKDA